MIFHMVKKEILILLKDKGLFFWTLVLPILFIVIFASVFGSAGSNSITLRYIDEDGSTASKEFLEIFEQIDGFKLQTENTPLSEQIEKIKQGKWSSLLVIPEGFGKNLKTGSQQAEITLYSDATAEAAVAPVQAVLQNIANGYREGKLASVMATAGMEGVTIIQALQTPIKIEEVRESAVKLDMVTQVIPGYTVMFVFFIMISMSTRFLKEKESGMVARLRTTMMEPIHFLIGMWVPHILIVLFQCTVLLTFGYFVYQLHLGNLLAVATVILALALCGTGLGLALSLIVQSENQGVAITQVIALGGAILGGLWFPFELLPGLIQKIGYFTPQYWAQKGLQDIMLRGAHLNDVWLTIIVLLGFAMLGLLLATLRYKRFLATSAN